MTVDQLIARVDALEPNQYSREQKIRWLSNLDETIYRELYLTHDVPEELLGDGFVPHETGDEELLVNGYFGDEMYLPYIQSKIAKENFEIDKYNVEILLFNNAYAEYANYINRTYMAKHNGPFRI